MTSNSPHDATASREMVLRRRRSRAGLPPLTVSHPDLCAQWHPVLNGELRPEDFSAGSAYDPWWICPRAGDHVFRMPINVRAKSTSPYMACYFCRGVRKSAVKPVRRRGRKFKQSIAITHLAIAAQWDYERNDPWVPEDFTAGSSFVAWWNCPLGHLFEQRIALRTGTRCLSQGCPDCRAQAIRADRRERRPLSTTHPQLALQWDYAKNRGKGPDAVTHGSNKRVWWKCDRGPDHDFESPISRRTKSTTETMACPYCAGKRPSVTNNLERYPHLLKEFSKKNKKTPDDVVAKSGRKLWWICSRCSKEWQATPAARICNEAGCPRCNRGDTIDLTRKKRLYALFDGRKNPGVDPRKIPVGTILWWKCPKGRDHTFQMGLYREAVKEKCPFCRLVKTSKDNSLASRAPELSRQWHKVNNGNLTPRDVRYSSNQKVWWKCPRGKDHEWEAVIYTRTKFGGGCPFCKNKRASEKSNITVTHPQIAAMFHSTKNEGVQPRDVVPGSGKTYWWQCRRGHDFQMATYVITKLNGECRVCKAERSPMRYAARIKKLHSTGLSQSEIGRRIGENRDLVKYVLEKLKAGQA